MLRFPNNFWQKTDLSFFVSFLPLFVWELGAPENFLKVHLRSSTPKGGGSTSPPRFFLTQTKKTGVFYVSISSFWKNHAIFQISRFTSEIENWQKRSFTGVCSKNLTKFNLKLFHWCFPPSGSRFCLVEDGNHILAAENIRNYQRTVLKIFKKILEKISFLTLI